MHSNRMLLQNTYETMVHLAEDMDFPIFVTIQNEIAELVLQLAKKHNIDFPPTIVGVTAICLGTVIAMCVKADEEKEKQENGNTKQ